MTPGPDLRLRLWDLGTMLPGRPGYLCHSRTRAWREPAALAAFDAALATLGPGDICLDLGANVGLFTARMAATGAQVHAFEPDPLAHEALTRATAHLPNVTRHAAAIGVEDGTASLSRPHDFAADPLTRTTGSSLVRRGRKMQPGAGLSVPVTGLFGFLDGLPRPAALIKMDIEGAEWAILDQIMQGRGAGRFDRLFVETHERFDTWALMPRLRRALAFAARTPHPEINLYWQ
jgi:FkbM family methyltransferase